MKLRAVGFDIDGTLYPEGRANRRSVVFVISHIRVISAFSRARRRMRADGADDGASELRLFAEELGRDVDTAKSIRDGIMYRGWEGCFRGMRIYPNVRKSLLLLKAAGLKLAVLSDFPVGRKLEYFGLADIFDAALGFPDSGRLKPNPEPFLNMAEILGVDPGEILYVGNKLAYDVRGAENAGMSGALIGPPGRKAPRGVITFSDYPRMADYILSEVER